MTYQGPEILLSVSQIAELANVGRSAVSNWPKRYRDFPEPRTVTPSGTLYDAAEVERWLIEKGRLSGPIPPQARLWSLTNVLRSAWQLTDVGDFIIGCLVYLEACARSESSPSGQVNVEQPDRWEQLRLAENKDLVSTLRKVAARIEEANPQLADLIQPAFQTEPRPDSSLVAQMLDSITASRNDDMPLSELFEEVIDRLHSDDRFFDELDTPDDLGYLIQRLAGPISGTVFDPAVGSGALLLQATLLAQTEGRFPHAIGWDINEVTLRRARARFFLYDVDADLSAVDALSEAPNSDVRGSVVVLDPPLRQVEWGDADLYLDPYWRYGRPSPTSADLAWIQVALNSLEEGGRAVVVLAASDLTQEGRDQQVRQNIIDAQVVEAIVLLPPRMRRDTSAQLAVWVLRAPPVEVDPDYPILLIDASSLGRPSRTTHSLDESDIDRIAEMVQVFSEEPYLEIIYDPLLAERDATGEVNRDDTELFATSRYPHQLVEANLNPRRYQEAKVPDLEHLREEAVNLRFELGQTAMRLDGQIADLFHSLGVHYE